MEEKLYKKMKSVGVSNLVFGIVTIAFGIGAGQACRVVKLWRQLQMAVEVARGHLLRAEWL